MKNILSFCFIVLIVTNTNAQSLIQKFVENTFVLSDSLKSPDGFYFGAITYTLQAGSILMINAEGNENNVKPMFIIRGPIQYAKEIIPTLNFFDTSYQGKQTNAVYTINATGNYSIIIANGVKGGKGTIKTKMGLGSIDWLDNKNIFPTTSNSPFILALCSLLRHAIFNFNLMKGEKDMWGNYKPTLHIPLSWQEDAATRIGSFSDLDANMKVSSYYACSYSMNLNNYESLPGKDADNYSLWDQKDTSFAIAKYERLKLMLTDGLTTDFIVEREANFPLFTKGIDKHTIRKNGRRIIFAHKGNEAIIDPSNKFYSLLASNKMKVELCLHSDNTKAEVYLRVYSEEK